MQIHTCFPEPGPLYVKKRESTDFPSSDALQGPILPPADAVQHNIEINNKNVSLIINKGEVTSMWMNDQESLYVLERFGDLLSSLKTAAERYNIPINEEEIRTKVHPLYNSIDDIYEYYLSEIERFEKYINNHIVFAEVLTVAIHYLITFPFGVKEFYGDEDFYQSSTIFLSKLEEKVECYIPILKRFQRESFEYRRGYVKELFQSLIWHFTPNDDIILHQDLFGFSNISELSPEEMYTHFRNTYLSLDPSDKVRRIIWEDKVRAYGRGHDYRKEDDIGKCGFLIYFEGDPNIWGDLENFKREFFEQADTLEHFLDMVAENHI